MSESTTCGYFVITPEKATEVLRLTKQRPLRTDHVKHFAEEMRRGAWIQGVAILIDDDGCCVDGQHRLHAVVESDTAQVFSVVRGPRAELLAMRECRQSRADMESKLRGRPIRPRTKAIMDEAGSTDVDACERIAALANRVRGGGASLGAVLLECQPDEAERFVHALLVADAGAPAVLQAWLARNVVRPSVSDRRGIRAACKLAISRWQEGRPCTLDALTKAFKRATAKA